MSSTCTITKGGGCGENEQWGTSGMGVRWRSNAGGWMLCGVLSLSRKAVVFDESQSGDD